MTSPDTPVPISLKEAARMTGVSLSTLRRKRDELRSHGATQHADGSWSIPIHTLMALGMLDRVKPQVGPPDTPVTETPRHPPADTPQSAEVEELRRQLADAERRAAVAEAIAAERERIIDAQQLALRAIAERPHQQPPQHPVVEEPPPRPPEREQPQPQQPPTTPTPVVEPPAPASPAPAMREQPAEQPAKRGFWSRLLGS